MRNKVLALTVASGLLMAPTLGSQLGHATGISALTALDPLSIINARSPGVRAAGAMSDKLPRVQPESPASGGDVPSNGLVSLPFIQLPYGDLVVPAQLPDESGPVYVARPTSFAALADGPVGGGFIGGGGGGNGIVPIGGGGGGGGGVIIPDQPTTPTNPTTPTTPVTPTNPTTPTVPVIPTTPTSPVPEPVSWLMLIVGFAFVGLRLRKAQTQTVAIRDTRTAN